MAHFFLKKSIYLEQNALAGCSTIRQNIFLNLKLFKLVQFEQEEEILLLGRLNGIQLRAKEREKDNIESSKTNLRRRITNVRHQVDVSRKRKLIQRIKQIPTQRLSQGLVGGYCQKQTNKSDALWALVEAQLVGWSTMTPEIRGSNPSHRQILIYYQLY